MTLLRAIFILTSILLSAPFLFAATVDDLRTLVQKQMYSEAYQLASSMSTQESGNPDFDFLYGISARKSGHPDVAMFALERVIINNPMDTVALYERGIALLEVRDLHGAQYSFEKVLSLTPNDDLKSNTDSLLKLTRLQLNKDKKSVFFSMRTAIESGFSSNVNSGVADIVEVPSGAPAVMDGYVNFGVAALLKRKLSKMDSYFFSLSSNNRKYFRSQNWDFNVFTARSGLELGLGPLQLRLPVEAELILNNYEIVRIMPSLGFELNRTWNEDNLTTLGIRVRHKGYLNSASNHLSPRFSLNHQVFSLFQGLNLNAEVFFAPGFAYATQPGAKVKCELGARADVLWHFLESHSLLGSLQFVHFRFPVSSTPNATRFDENIAARVGYEWRFAKDWFVGPAFLYFFNHSTDPERRYMRYQGQLGLRYEI